MSGFKIAKLRADPRLLQQDLQRPWQADNATHCLQLDRTGFSYHESTNTDIGEKSMHFTHIHQRNRSKGQHMQKAEMSIPRIAPKKKAAKAAKAAKADTVTLRHLAVTLAESHGVPKSQVNAMLMGMVGEIAKHLKKGRRIRINGLGIIQVRRRPARMGRNPATGEAIKIKASKKIAFRAAKDLKGAI
jgi:DNA-binding protein HU-beta